MKKKEIAAVVENSFKILNKLFHKIPKEFDEGDIHDFRVEVKKLRAFLRVAGVKKDKNPVIPKSLKTLYGQVGRLRNIQLLKKDLFKYTGSHYAKKPGTYLKLLKLEENTWKKYAKTLIKHDDLQDTKEIILKALPGKPDEQRIKKFVQNKLAKLKDLFEADNNDNAMHSIRKTLKDLLYTWHYIKDDTGLSTVISGKEEMKSMAAILGDFMDKSMELEFLQPSRLNTIKINDEKHLLLNLRKAWHREKLTIKKEAVYSLHSLKKQLKEMEL